MSEIRFLFESKYKKKKWRKKLLLPAEYLNFDHNFRIVLNIGLLFLLSYSHIFSHSLCCRAKFLLISRVSAWQLALFLLCLCWFHQYCQWTTNVISNSQILHKENILFFHRQQADRALRSRYFLFLFVHFLFLISFSISLAKKIQQMVGRKEGISVCDSNRRTVGTYRIRKKRYTWRVPIFFGNETLEESFLLCVSVCECVCALCVYRMAN